MKSSLEGHILQEVSMEGGRRRDDLAVPFHHVDVGSGFQVLERGQSKHEYHNNNLHFCVGLSAVMLKGSMSETTDLVTRGGFIVEKSKKAGLDMELQSQIELNPVPSDLTLCGSG